MASSNLNEMATESISKLVLKFSIPAIVGIMCSALQNIINRIFVGQGIGANAISAVVVSFPIMIVMMAIAMLFGVGATTLTSIKLGEGNIEAGNKLLVQTTILLIIVPLSIAVLMFAFLEPLLIFSGAEDPVVLDYAKRYLSTFFIFLPFTSLNTGMNNFIRVEGSPNTAMATQFVAFITSIAFNYLFVMRFGWEVEGAAIGSGLAACFAVLWIFWYFRPKSKSLLKFRWKNRKFDKRLLKAAIILGVPVFLMQMASCVQTVIMNRVLYMYGGSVALAAVGIVGSLSSILVMPISGISQGTQPILGFSYGSRNYKRLKASFYIGVLYATIVALICFTAVQFFAAPLTTLFASADEREVIDLASHAIKIFFMFLPVVGFLMIGSAFFQATNKPIKATIVSLSRQVLFYIPLLLILPNFMGLDGAWYAAAISDIGAAIMTFILIFFEMRYINRMIIYKNICIGDDCDKI